MAENKPVAPDTIRDACVKRADALGMTAYAIAKATDGAVSQLHVKAYLTGRKSMTSSRLQHVLQVLRLKLVADHTGSTARP